MNNPTASKTGVTRLTITFCPIDGISAGTLSEFARTFRMICTLITSVNQPIRLNRGSRPSSTLSAITT